MTRDVKQASFRLNTDDTEKFKSFCEESEMTAAQGFSVLLEILELDRAGRALPSRQTEIENFEQLTKGLVSAFLHSLELNEGAESRIREQFSMQIDSQTRTISEYQEQIKELKTQLEESLDFTEAYRADLQAMQDSLSEAENTRLQAENDLNKLKSDRDKQLSDKESIIAMLTVKLAEAEGKANGYDDLASQNADLSALLRTSEQTLKDHQKDASVGLERAVRALEKAKDKEINDLREKHSLKISTLQQDLLNTERSSNEKIRSLEKEKSALREELLELKSKTSKARKN